MKITITFLLTVVLGTYGFAQRFADTQWEKLSEDAQQTLDEIANATCECFKENKYEAQHLQKNVMHYSKVKRTGTELSELEKSNLEVAIKFAEQYLTCIKKNGVKSEKGKKLFGEIQSLYEQEFDDETLAKLKVNTLVYKLSKDCSSEAASNLMMILYFLQEHSKQE